MEVDGCPFPDDLAYDVDNDTWLRYGEPGAPITLGLTSLISSFAGRFTAVSFRPAQGTVAAGRSVATVESLRYTGAVRLAFPAQVVDRNTELLAHPRRINDDPYGAGWLVRLRPAGPATAAILPAPQARARLAERRASLAVRCWPAVPDTTMVEVGVECQAILARLDEEIARREPSEVILLVTDDPTSPIEMQRWLDRTGHALLVQRREEALYQFLLRKEPRPRPKPIRGSELPAPD